MTTGAEEKLQELGLTLPDVAKPVAAYVPWVRTGNLVFISGQLPTKDGALVYAGKVGSDLTVEQGYEAAGRAAVNALAALREAAGGSLDNVTRIVRLEGWVASAAGFTDQPKVVNGASELIGDVFGDAGKHARAAVGANELPLNTPVEIALIAEVSD